MILEILDLRLRKSAREHRHAFVIVSFCFSQRARLKSIKLVVDAMKQACLSAHWFYCVR
jgi:hypothetical protein